MANTERIDRVFDAITVENLDMNTWASKGTPEASCGTTMCFAGHAVVVAGHQLRWEPVLDKEYQYGEDGYTITGSVDTVVGYYADYTTDGALIEEVAANWLDLTVDQAFTIFHSTGIGKDVDRLKKKVKAVLEGGDEDPDNY